MCLVEGGGRMDRKE